jgi:hypothetical protein
MSLNPEISGSVGIQSPADRLLPAFEQRVAAGLLAGAADRRSNYRVVSSSPERLSIEAGNWWTAFNVGLNDVELRLLQPGAVKYRVRYWRWAWSCIALCGVLGLAGIVLLVTTDARAYMADTVVATIPGLSADQHVVIAWGMALFWGFVWPWMMIAFHKRPLHKLMTQLIREVDARAASPAS